MVTCVCKNCKNEYQVSEYRLKRTKYCSSKCLYEKTESWLVPFKIEKATQNEKLERIKENYEKYVVRKEGCWDWTGYIDEKGYTLLSCSYKLGTTKGHRASWMIHRGLIPKGKLIRHICNNPICTNPEHLAIGTHQDNTDDKIKTGRQVRGSKHGSAKLNEDQVKEIKNHVHNGISGPKIAKNYNVSCQVIYDIKNKKAWRHVDL